MEKICKGAQKVKKGRVLLAREEIRDLNSNLYGTKVYYLGLAKFQLMAGNAI